TTFTLPVDIRDPNFTTLSDLNVMLNLVHPTNGELDVQLLPAGKLKNPIGVVVNPVNGDLYIASHDNNSIVQYNANRPDPNDPFHQNAGHLRRVFVNPNSGGLDGPEYLVFGPDGNLYVTSGFSNNVLEYDGTTGAFIRTFVTAGSGGLASPTGITFGADG